MFIEKMVKSPVKKTSIAQALFAVALSKISSINTI